MPDDNPLPWTDRHWDELRSVALDAARKSRVASTFLPLVGPYPADQATVPSNWLEFVSPAAGGADPRLEVRAGRTLQLVTLSCNIYLRGSEIADPDLDAAKSMVRRAGEVLGRLEDAVVFYGLPPHGQGPRFDGLTIRPDIYTITGGSDLTGLLHSPTTLLAAEAARKGANQGLVGIRRAAAALVQQRQGIAAGVFGARYQALEDQGQDQLMCVRLEAPPAVPGAPGPPGAPGVITGTHLFTGVVDAIQRLEARGHFGPFAVVLGHELFRLATTPSRSLVLPTDRLAEFLDGRRVQRSGVLPSNRGVVVALGGQPIELVLANDIDVRFLQATLEPRYVLRVFERLVLRIKELDAVCVVTTDTQRLSPETIARRA
ncbi:MAG: encapsulin [Pseudonocardia sp.]|nr:encapsulin [Pseudonocardia sp.]